MDRRAAGRRCQQLRLKVLTVPFVALTAAGCAPSSAHVAVSVEPSMSLADQPVHISVRGLKPAEKVTLKLTSTDGRGIQWSSSALFRADSGGTVKPDLIAPTSGDYRGVFGMGLIASMGPAGDTPGVYVYSGVTPQYPAFEPQIFTISVTSNGENLASETFRRRLPAAVSAHYITYEQAGFVGTFYTPLQRPMKRTSVLIFGGSEGGNSTTLLGVMLASHGFPTLSIAYFRAPGLPPSLSNIPLEYFVKAIQWLDAQPGVDPSHVVVSGLSRGSEAALLLGVHFPQLVHGVIGSVPNDAALCGLPCSRGPVWTIGGKPLPYTSQFDQPYPTDTPGAVIPVEAVKGPILLDCGGADQVWTSCAFTHAIEARLDRAHDPYPHVVYAYPKAGHGVGGLVPYEPTSANVAAVNGSLVDTAGTNADANAIADADLWPKVIAFLQAA
jgi:dienelactone hydrolase